LVSSERGTLQTAYQIRLATSEENLTKNKLLWDSGKLASDASISCCLPGPALETGRRYYWQVRVTDNLGRTSDWSAPAFWEMGLLHDSDWQAALDYFESSGRHLEIESRAYTPP